MIHRKAFHITIEGCAFTFMHPVTDKHYKNGEILVIYENASGDTIAKISPLRDVVIKWQPKVNLRPLLKEISNELPTLATDLKFQYYLKETILEDMAMPQHVKFFLFCDSLKN